MFSFLNILVSLQRKLRPFFCFLFALIVLTSLNSVTFRDFVTDKKVLQLNLKRQLPALARFEDDTNKP